MTDVIEAPSPSGDGGGGGAGKALTRQVGPLPAWGWVLVLGVAGAIVVVRRRKSAGTTADQGTTTYAQQAQIPTIGNLAGASGGPVVSGGRPAPTTNDQWRSLAVTTLLAKGYSPLAVDTAMGKYLQGVPLDSTERALIDIALAEVGVPPNPPPPAQSAPTTSTANMPDWLGSFTETKDPAGHRTGLNQSIKPGYENVVGNVTYQHLDYGPDGHVSGGYVIDEAGHKIPLTPDQIQVYRDQPVVA